MPTPSKWQRFMCWIGFHCRKHKEELGPVWERHGDGSERQAMYGGYYISRQRYKCCWCDHVWEENSS